MLFPQKFNIHLLFIHPICSSKSVYDNRYGRKDNRKQQQFTRIRSRSNLCYYKRFKMDSLILRCDDDEFVHFLVAYFSSICDVDLTHKSIHSFEIFKLMPEIMQFTFILLILCWFVSRFSLRVLHA